MRVTPDSDLADRELAMVDLLAHSLEFLHAGAAGSLLSAEGCGLERDSSPNQAIYVLTQHSSLSPSQLATMQILAPWTTCPMIPCSQLWSLLALHSEEDDTVSRLSTRGKQAHCSWCYRMSHDDTGKVSQHLATPP